MTSGLVLGSLLAGASMAFLKPVWVVAAAARIAWLGIGIGYTFVEVAARTLLQRLGSDETLASTWLSGDRALGRNGAGLNRGPGLIALVGIEGALVARSEQRCRALPCFAGPALRGLEIGAPVEEDAIGCCAETRSSRRCRWTRSSVLADLVPLRAAMRRSRLLPREIPATASI